MNTNGHKCCRTFAPFAPAFAHMGWPSMSLAPRGSILRNAGNNWRLAQTAYKPSALSARRGVSIRG